MAQEGVPSAGPQAGCFPDAGGGVWQSFHGPPTTSVILCPALGAPPGVPHRALLCPWFAVIDELARSRCAVSQCGKVTEPRHWRLLLNPAQLGSGLGARQCTGLSAYPVPGMCPPHSHSAGKGAPGLLSRVLASGGAKQD